MCPVRRRFVSPLTQGVKLTYEALMQFPDDGMRHEVVDGAHHVTPAPSLKHQAVAGAVYFFVKGHVVRTGSGRVYVAPTDVVFSDVDVVRPDVLYVCEEHLAIRADTFIRGAPDLVVEVGSASTRRRDLRDKLHLYERRGVQEYWFVDPELETVAVYRHEDGRFVRTHELSLDNGDTLSSPLLPGLDIPLAEIFRD